MSTLSSYQQLSYNNYTPHLFVPKQRKSLYNQTVIYYHSMLLSETNLKKQGMLPLTFVNPDDYEKVGEADRVSLVGLGDLAPGKVRTSCSSSYMYLMGRNSVEIKYKWTMNVVNIHTLFRLDGYNSDIV